MSNGTDHIGPAIGVAPDASISTTKSVARAHIRGGVSTEYVPNKSNEICETKSVSSSSESRCWYALRSTYGREKKASDFIAENGGIVFCPMITVTKLVDNKRKHVDVSRLPNIFFAYGSRKEIEAFVYDNVNLPFLRFYYRYYRVGKVRQKEPMIVPDNQIESLKLICGVEKNHDTLLLNGIVPKFQEGEHVRVIDGDFKGVTGIVARFKGQQRVGIVIEGLFTAITAYIPNAFLQKID